MQDLRLAVPLRAHFPDVVERPDVAVIIQRIVHVRHAELLPLVDIGRPLHAEQQDRQHFRARFPVFAVIPPAGDAAGQIVVFPEKAVPAFSVKLRLPAAEYLLEL